MDAEDFGVVIFIFALYLAWEMMGETKAPKRVSHVDSLKRDRKYHSPLSVIKTKELEVRTRGVNPPFYPMDPALTEASLDEILMTTRGITARPLEEPRQTSFNSSNSSLALFRLHEFTTPHVRPVRPEKQYE